MEQIIKMIISPYTDKLIMVHQYQAQSNNCGPFCAAMAINSIMDLHLDGSDLAKSMNHPRFNLFIPVIRRIPEYATFPWGITDVLWEYGIKSSWKFFNAFSNLTELLPENLMLILLTATYKPINAHYRILASLENEQIGFVDPAYPVKEIHYQSRSSFLEEWKNAFNPIITVQID
jgi:hypothetical protein